MPDQCALCFKNMGLELRHLQALIAVSEEGSISRAARRLHVGQPALSRSIAQLEREIGARLFDRTSAGATLTTTGEAYLVRASRAISAFDLAVQPPESVGTVTVGYVWSALGSLTNTVFETWNATKPQEQLMLKRFASRTSGVESGEADLGIVRQGIASVSFSSSLFGEARVVALSQRHRLADRPELALSDLSDDIIVLDIMSGTTTMDLWPAHTRPFSRPIECGSVDEWNHHVSLGHGIGITAESTPHMHPYPGIVYVPMKATTPRIEVFCIWDSPHLTPVATEFCAMVRTVHKHQLTSKSESS